MDTRKYLQDNYDSLYEKAQTMRFFDEDVFQNTMLYIIVNSEILTEETLNNYIIHALRINFIRERQYSRNKSIPLTINNISFDIDTESYVDINIIYDKISAKYGDELLDCYKMHVTGYAINEIKSLYPKIKNLNKKIKDIESYISGL